MKIIKIFLILLISALFFSSAYNKITNFNSVADGLKNKIYSSVLFNWMPDISKFALLFAIFLLLSGPIMMIYGTLMDTNLVTKIGALLLIVFLILATILYHPPNDPAQLNNFLKNLSLMGGLGMLMI